ncbi:hypothetical protein EHR02_16580 [Leptospira levettii]|nr:hypothetical protein EHR02_16580 [Leptospira levettii]
MQKQATCQSLTSRWDSGSGNVVYTNSLCDIAGKNRHIRVAFVEILENYRFDKYTNFVYSGKL